MISSFTNIDEFESRVKAFGVNEDLRSLLALDLTFFEKYGDYVIINLRDYSEQPNNLLVLSETENFLFNGKAIAEDQFKLYKNVLKKKYGESTALALVAFKRVLSGYSAEFENVNMGIDKQEELLDPSEIEHLGRRLRRLANRVEDVLDILIKLQDREVKEVDTNYVRYDFDLLGAQAHHLLDRVRAHITQIAGLRNEVEIRATRELNKRIENLSDIVKKLTAITLLFLIPNIVTGHYGMNLKYFGGFIDVTSPAAEATIVIVTIGLMLMTAVFLRWKKWL